MQRHPDPYDGQQPWDTDPPPEQRHSEHRVEDAELTQLQPAMTRRPATDVPSAPTEGFGASRWTGPHESGVPGSPDRSWIVPAVLLVAVLLGGGGLLAYLWLSNDSADTPAPAPGPTSSATAAPDLSWGLVVDGIPTDREVLLVVYTFLQKVRDRDCGGAMTMTGRDLQFSEPVLSHISRRYVCIGRVANHAEQGFKRRPTLHANGTTDVAVRWNSDETIGLKVLGDRLKVTSFSVDLYS